MESDNIPVDQQIDSNSNLNENPLKQKRDVDENSFPRKRQRQDNWKNNPKGNWRNNSENKDGVNEQVISNVDINDPIVQQFQSLSKLYDQLADIGENIFQNSRNVTRDSKKVVSLLHRFHGNNFFILDDAEKQLKFIVTGHIKKILDQLNNVNSKHAYFLYLSKLAPGIEEFIEAVSMLWFFRTRRLVTLEEVNSFLGMNIDLHTYICGISDLGGELMRYCTSSVSRGDKNICFDITKFLVELNKNYLILPIEEALDTKERTSFISKISTLQQSTMKCEKILSELILREEDSKITAIHNII